MSGTGIAGGAGVAAPPTATDETVLRDIKALLKYKAAKLQEAAGALQQMELEKNNKLLMNQMEMATMRKRLSEAETSVICLLAACCLFGCVCSMCADCSYLCRLRSCSRRRARSLVP
jgi:hypothetical protein